MDGADSIKHGRRWTGRTRSNTGGERRGGLDQIRAENDGADSIKHGRRIKILKIPRYQRRLEVVNGCGGFELFDCLKYNKPAVLAETRRFI